MGGFHSKRKKQSWHPNQKSEPQHIKAICMYTYMFLCMSCTIFVSHLPFGFFFFFPCNSFLFHSFSYSQSGPPKTKGLNLKEQNQLKWKVLFSWYKTSHQITTSLYLCKAVLSLLVGHKLPWYRLYLQPLFQMWDLIRQWWDKHTWTSRIYGCSTISVKIHTLNIWAVVFWLSQISVLVLFIPSSIESSCQEARRCSIFA